MKQHCLIWPLILGIFFVGKAQSTEQLSANIFTIKASGCVNDGATTLHVQTGFRAKGIFGIVTALHGICGCQYVSAINQTGETFHNLTISQIDIEHDIAVVSSNSSKTTSPDIGLEVSYEAHSKHSDRTAIAYGHPQGIENTLMDHLIRIRKQPIRRLEELLDPQTRALLSTRNSPSPSIEVLNIEGFVQRGLSGGPIALDGKVIGVMNGGLNNGMGGIGWAIPIKDFNLKPFSEVRLSNKYTSLIVQDIFSLFSIDSPDLLYGQRPFRKGDISLKVLVLPFQRIEDCIIQNSNVELGIVRHFENQHDILGQSITAKYVPIPKCISSKSEALMAGQEFNADVVIWGDQYEYCYSDSNRTCLKYAFVSDRTSLKEAETGMQNFYRYQELGFGYLQNDVDFVVDWISGINALRSSNPAVAVRIFKSLKKKAISKKEKSTFHILIGGAYAKMSHRGKTEFHLRKAVHFDPENGAIYFIIGEIQRAQKVGMPVKPYLLAYLNGNVRVKAKSLEVLAQFAINNVDSSLSRLLLNRLFEVDPGNLNYVKIEAEFTGLWGSTKGEGHADSLYQVYLSRGGADYEVLLQQGRAMMDSGMWESALHYLQKLDSVCHDIRKSIDIKWSMYSTRRSGYIAFGSRPNPVDFNMKDFEEGIIMVDFRSLMTTHILAMYYLANIEDRFGDQRMARKYLEQLLSIKKELSQDLYSDYIQIDSVYDLAAYYSSFEREPNRKTSKIDTTFWAKMILANMLNDNWEQAQRIQEMTGVQAWWVESYLAHPQPKKNSYSLNYYSVPPVLPSDSIVVIEDLSFPKWLDHLFAHDYYKWKDEIRQVVSNY